MGCYHGARASRDINAAWIGRSSAAIQSRWGKPAQVDGDVMVWTKSDQHVELPSASGHLSIRPGEAEGSIAASSGAIWTTHTNVAAKLDASGTIVDVQGPSVRWGAPNDVNLRYGAIMGLEIGMGTSHDRGTPLPSGSFYIGGMLGPRMGLIGVYSMGSSTNGIGMAGAIAVQYWPATRFSLRVGPAAVLLIAPTSFAPGVDGSASWAFVKAGKFAVDLRIDLVASSDGSFGSLGVGANLN